MRGVNNVRDDCSRAYFNLSVLSQMIKPIAEEKEYILCLSYAEIFEYFSFKEKVENEITKWFKVVDKLGCE